MTAFYRTAICFASAWLGALPAAAQTTATQRQAAEPVVAQIEALQADIRPAELAQRLTGAHSSAKQELMARVEQLWTTELGALSDYIGRHPEIGFEEHATVDTLMKVLSAHGFDVESGQAGLETAFVGSWTSPAGADGPTLGIIVEYDALRGTSEPFHGCQHNAQSPVGFAAAVALMDHMTAEQTPGAIKV